MKEKLAALFMLGYVTSHASLLCPSFLRPHRAQRFFVLEPYASPQHPTESPRYAPTSHRKTRSF